MQGAYTTKDNINAYPCRAYCLDICDDDMYTVIIYWAGKADKSSPTCNAVLMSNGILPVTETYKK